MRDQEIIEQIHEKYKHKEEKKYFKKKMVIQNIYSDDKNVIVVPSWASNKEAIAKISIHQ